MKKDSQKLFRKPKSVEFVSSQNGTGNHFPNPYRKRNDIPRNNPRPHLNDNAQVPSSSSWRGIILGFLFVVFALIVALALALKN